MSITLALFAVTTSIVLLGVGAWLLRRGRRGVPVDDHPICRRCGFDLFGLPAGHAACPECGADVLAANAVRVGHRRTRPGLTAAGALLVLLAIGIGTAATVRVARTFNPQDYKPVWWLVSEAQGKAGPTSDAALAELQQRLSARELRAASFKRIAEAALAHQGNANVPWDKRWGALVEGGRAAGLVDDATWKRYLAQIPVLSVTIRPTLGRGQPLLPFDVRPTAYRCADPTLFRVNFQPTAIEVNGFRLNGGRSRLSGSSPQQLHSGPASAMPNTGAFDVSDAAIGNIADGTHTARVTLSASIWEAEQVALNEAGRAHGYPDPMAFARQVVECPLIILPDAQGAVKLVHEPHVCDAMERAITLGVTTNAGLPFQAIRAHDGSFTTSLRADNPPIGGAYDMIFRAGGTEYEGATVVWEPGQSTSRGYLHMRPPFDADTIDVILRPNPTAARNASTKLSQISGREIVFRDVKVVRVDTSGRPVTRPAK